ncbi:condensation domain-containing protein [Rhodococcus sp. 3Y1]
MAERSVDAYLVQVALDLAGAVDSERLRRAADALLGRYENLRTAFLHSADGRAVRWSEATWQRRGGNRPHWCTRSGN